MQRWQAVRGEHGAWLDLGSDSAADLLCGFGSSSLSRLQFSHFYNEGLLTAWAYSHWTGEKEWPDRR